MNIPSEWNTASINPDHAMILPHDANLGPDGIFGKDRSQDFIAARILRRRTCSISVERSKLFVLDRAAAVEELDSAPIARAIGFTRFPYASFTNDKEDEVRDLIPKNE